MDAVAQLKASLAGRYTVDHEIGRGGMATVYLARDVRHNRPVALKVLNPELGAVLGVERFLSEIQVTANLQHPNLLPLFDSGEADGLLFYVMPYVEGESLRAHIQRQKQLPIDEALHIATAVASALDYAHRHGVIHRDLKPENILLHEGEPMVADFGIALAVSNAGGNRITQTGLSLGTPQYMSPEQATGDRDIDGRTDVYSLGAVLYEMLAGEPPHDGKTSQAIIAKVITDKPRRLRLSRDTVPVPVEAAVERALAKLPADRFPTAHEFSDALLGKNPAYSSSFATPSVPSGSHTAAAPRRASVVKKALPWAVAAAALVLAGTALVMATRTPADPSTLRFEIRIPSSTTIVTGLGNPVAIGPDGRYIAYSANLADGSRKLFVRSANDLVPREVPGSEYARYPFFSPDGKWVAFWAAGQLKKAAVEGGGAVLLTDLPVVTRVSWSPSGRLIMSVDGKLATMSAAGGAPIAISTPDSTKGETMQVAPIALADGKTALYTSMAMGGAAAARIGVVSLDNGSTTILDLQGSFPLGVLDGYLIYTTAGGAVMAAQYDAGKRKVIGVPVPVIDQVANETGNPNSYADLSHDGTLVYLSGLSQRQVMMVTSAGAAHPILPDAGGYGWPRLSPDGKRIAITVSTPSRSDVWIYDLPSGPLTRVTTEGATNDRPEWMPDGRSVMFRSNRGGLNALWIQPIDGAGATHLLFGLKEAKIDEGALSPDGKFLLFQRDRTGRGELWYVAVEGDTTQHRVGTGPNGEVGGRFSPDGKWVVYASSESGTSQVYVRPFPSLAARYQISLNGGATPVWSPDGKRIFYTADRQIIAATIGSTQPFSIASRAPVLSREYTFNGIHADYDVAKDGRTFVALRPADVDAQLIAVHNWRAELRARMEGTRR